MKNTFWRKRLCTALMVAGLVLANGRAQAQTTTPAASQGDIGPGGKPASSGARASSPGLPSTGDTAARPWAIGVSLDDQKHAESLYHEGTRDFTNDFFAAAVTKYQAALQRWSHPRIHYSLALALIALDRPVEAYDGITAALTYGADGLHPEEYQRALDYRRVLRRRIAAVEIVCEQTGAEVTLDGKPLFTGPGRVTTIVLPGKHQAVASKRGHLVTTRSFELAPAGRKRIELRLLAAHRPSTRTSRWPTWPQWAATGLGLGAGAAAAIVHWQFHLDTHGLADTWRRHCPEGCTSCWGVRQQRAARFRGYRLDRRRRRPRSGRRGRRRRAVVRIAAGYEHTCALLDTGAVRCWGEGGFGRLGYGRVAVIGDDETPASAGDVDIGGTAIHIAAGYAHTCAVLDTYAIRCWGHGYDGQLGYGNTATIGDNEFPASADDVNVN